MRCWGSFAASALLALVCAAPAAAADGVDRFARETNAFLDARRDAGAAAQAAAQRRRDAIAQDCLDVFKSAPAATRDLLGVVYDLDVSGGFLSVDEPLYRRYLKRLGRVALRAQPALMRARRVLRTEVAFFGLIPLVFDDACTTARAWQAAGWRTPPRSIRIFHRLATIEDATDQDLLPASRLLGDAGHERAARAVLDAFAPPDTVIQRAGDPVRCALDPEGCHA